MTPYNPSPDQLGPMPEFNTFLRENGLFTFVRWHTFIINPSLCITEQA